MIKLTVLIICSSILNIVNAQKKEKTIVLTPFAENILKKYDIEIGPLTYPLFNEYNFKKGISKYISAYISGENQYEYKSSSSFTIVSSHTFTLLCIIDGNVLKLKSKWYDKAPDILNFENDDFYVKIILGIPEDTGQFKMTITRKYDRRSEIFKLFFWRYEYGE